MHAASSHTGRAYLITGAARRLGAATARRLHGSGASIAIHYRDSADAAEALVAELNAGRRGSAIWRCCASRP